MTCVYSLQKLEAQVMNITLQTQPMHLLGSSGAATITLVLGCPRFDAEVPCFRGQPSEYARVQTGAHRHGSENPFISTIDWFGVLMCAWLEFAVPAPRDPDGLKTTFVLSREERLYLAQHYYNELGIRTPLIDWTFDPIVAFLFALSSSSGRILLNDRGLDLRSYLVLPPLQIIRPWSQKAVHGWNCDFPVTALDNVMFPVSDEDRAAASKSRDLLFSADPICALARIAKDIPTDSPCPASLVHFPRYAYLQESHPAIAKKLKGISAPPPRGSLFFDYVDCVAFRKLENRDSYDVAALFGILSNAFWVGDELEDECDRKLKGDRKSRGGRKRRADRKRDLVRSVWKDPGFRRAIIESTGRYDFL